MSRYDGQLIATAIRPDVKLGSKTVSAIGRYFAHDDGLDGYDSVLFLPQQLLPESEDLLCGNQYKTILTLTEGMTNMVTDVSRALPNLAHVWVGNTERVVTGLLTLIGNLTGVTFHVADILLSAYQATYPTLTFVSYVYAPTFPIPFIGETTLTAEYVRQVIAITSGDPSIVGKVVVSPDFTSFETGVFDYIFFKFPNCEEIEYGGLPSEYQAVEYIESTGTQYINTNYNHNDNTAYEIDFVLSQKATTYQTLFGENDVNYQSADAYYLEIDDANAFNVGRNPTSVTKRFGTCTIGTRYLCTIGRTEAKSYANGVLNGQANYSGTVQTATKPDFLFAKNNGGTVGAIPNAKVYSFKVKEGSAIARYFVPCYRKSDNAIGFYDLSTKAFFGNSGTGVFLKGNDTTATDVTKTIERPDLFTCHIYHDENTSHTLTAQIVQDTLTRFPEYATCEKVIVDEWFTEYESGSINAIISAFSDMEVLTTTYKCGTIDFHISNGAINYVNDIPYSDALIEEVVSESRAVDMAMNYNVNTGYDGIPASFSNMRVAPPMIFPNLETWPNRLFVNHQNIVKVIPLLELPKSYPYFANLSLDGIKTIYGTQFVCSPAPKWIEADGCGAFSSINLSSGYNAVHVKLSGLLISANISTALSTSIIRDELVALLTSLGTPSTTQTLTIGATNLAKLTAEDIAIATAKNWTLQ